MTQQMPLFNIPKSSGLESHTLDQLKSKLNTIKNMGYIRSVYLHAGGIGNTLENLLDVKENNLTLPDLGNFELKARRKETGSIKLSVYLIIGGAKPQMTAVVNKAA